LSRRETVGFSKTPFHGV